MSWLCIKLQTGAMDSCPAWLPYWDIPVYNMQKRGCDLLLQEAFNSTLSNYRLPPHHQFWHVPHCCLVCHIVASCATLLPGAAHCCLVRHIVASCSTLLPRVSHCWLLCHIVASCATLLLRLSHCSHECHIVASCATFLPRLLMCHIFASYDTLLPHVTHCCLV